MLLIELFRSFYYRNYPEDMERCIELFAIFGGLDVDVDTSKHTHELIIEIVLEKYNLLKKSIDDLLFSDANAIRLLQSLCVGDRRIFSSFKRARLNNLTGGIALNLLEQNGLVKIEHSREQDKRAIKPKLSKEEAKHRISDKFLVVYPFLRFWFYFIHPHAKEIAKNDFSKILEDFERRKYSYTSLVFEELSRILLSYYLRDEIIETIDSYWDANVEVDIMVLTQKGNLYIAECKWTNHKVNKKEFNKLLEKCEIMQVHPKQLLFFSKRGFSNELKNLASKDLVLFEIEDFAQLVKSKPKRPLFPLAF